MSRENEFPCKGCGVDLSGSNSVVREYINKDDGPSAFGHGHYDYEGNYEADDSTDLSSGRYDLCDGSDTCAECGEVVG